MKDINDLMYELNIGMSYKQKFIQRLTKNSITVFDNHFISSSDYDLVIEHAKTFINLSEMVSRYLFQKVDEVQVARNSFIILGEIKKRNKDKIYRGHDTFIEFKKSKDIFIDKKYVKEFESLIQIYFSAFNEVSIEDNISIKKLCYINNVEVEDVLNEILCNRMFCEILGDYALIKLDKYIDICNLSKVKDVLANVIGKKEIKQYKEKLKESADILNLIAKNIITLEDDGEYYVSKERVSLVIDTVVNELQKIKDKEINIPIRTVSSLTGVSYNVLKEKLEAGILLGEKIENNWYLCKVDINKIRTQKEKYTCLNKIADNIALETKNLFNAKYKRDISELVGFLEQEDFFSVSYIESNKILFESLKQGNYYILNNDVDYLKSKINDFIWLFGLNTYDIYQKIDNVKNINTVKSVEYFKQYKKRFLDIKVDNNGCYLPSINIVYYFLKVKLKKELFLLSDEEIGKLSQDELLYSKSKVILCEFLKYLKVKTKTNYNNSFIKIISDSSKGKFTKEAYSYDTFMDFATCIFNENYISDYKMIKKALRYPLFAEMWLYHSEHYCCGWRSGDIITNWRYLDLNSINYIDCKYRGVSSEKLYEYIIENKISDYDFEQIAEKVLAEIQINPEYASKTNEYCAPALEMKIIPNLKKHFGMLTLIAEVHHLRNGKGYMKKSSAALYKNRVFMKDFYGVNVSTIFQGENLYSRALNKSYLQGLEEIARCEGWGGMVAYEIASYARNHISDIYHKSKSTCYYLVDGRFTERDAKDIIRMLFDCEVFSFKPYQLLMECFPNEYLNLSNDDQIRLINNLGLDAVEIEVSVRAYNRIQTLKDETSRFNSEKMLKLLTALHNIGAGFGVARSKGCYCFRRAVGEACDNSNRRYCIGCENCIITSKALPAIIEVAYFYKRQYALSGGDRKYLTLYNGYVFPAINETLKAFTKSLNEVEIKELYKIVGEINKEYDKRSKITG